MRLTFLLATAIAVATTFSSDQSSAEDLFTVTADNSVNVVDSASPTSVIRSGSISGLSASETIFGLDYRANGGGIYAISSLNNVYTIDQNSFAATQVGSLSEALVGSSFAYDFNPSAAGGILSRIISDTDNNRVIDSTTGDYFGSTDKTPVFYNTGDANEGVNPNIQGIAYNNNVLGATTTQQFGIDATLGIVTTVANNAGTLDTVGSLGLGALTNEVAFDISGDTGTAFASLQLVGGESQLYTIDLDTGAATLVGGIAGGATVRDFTIVPVAAVPEPSSLIFCASALAAFVSRRRRNVV
jgi:hypothetical protein